MHLPNFYDVFETFNVICDRPCSTKAPRPCDLFSPCLLSLYTFLLSVFLILAFALDLRR